MDVKRSRTQPYALSIVGGAASGSRSGDRWKRNQTIYKWRPAGVLKSNRLFHVDNNNNNNNNSSSSSDMCSCCIWVECMYSFALMKMYRVESRDVKSDAKGTG